MNYTLKGVQLFLNEKFKKYDLLISNGIIEGVVPSPNNKGCSFESKENGCIVTPGLIDVHVHLREPGFFYKEGILSGTKAAARGGYTSICAMPNLAPVPDTLENLKIQTDLIAANAQINVYPYGAITMGQMGEDLSDMEKLSSKVVAFSDDGRGVQSSEIMKVAMLKAKSLGKIIVAHCEDNSLIAGGYIHDGQYAKKNFHKGISSASEYKQVERDLQLVKETSCAYHICHISTKESVELVRRAKSEGLDVTCETAPHYLLLDDTNLKEDGNFKMNPPLRSEADRQALIEGIIDGTIDMIATDHAPHTKEEKSKGLRDSLMGIVGLETAFPLLYTELVKKGIISLEKLIMLMHTNPSRRFKIGKEIIVGQKADIAVFDLGKKYIINPDNFLSKGRSTPFAGYEVYGESILTIVGGKTAWEKR
ncbi:MAG TPA: dihydroorotase [Clostridia bacterium]|nr:dihydroorotase [Clostridia bacterium]